MKKIVVIKLGGNAIQENEIVAQLIRELQITHKEQSFILVHGGGWMISSIANLLGIKSKIRDGIRLTTMKDMPVVDMVLCGLVNKRLTRLLVARGLPAVGLSGSDGGTFIGAPMQLYENARKNREQKTGVVVQKNPALMRYLLDGGYIPVLAPVIMDIRGEALNLNADHAALELGTMLNAHTILFCSDVDGVLLKGEPTHTLNKEQAEQAIESGDIKDGMVVKVRTCFDALEQGVTQISIGKFEETGDLSKLLNKEKGTVLH